VAGNRNRLKSCSQVPFNSRLLFVSRERTTRWHPSSLRPHSSLVHSRCKAPWWFGDQFRCLVRVRVTPWFVDDETKRPHPAVAAVSAHFARLGQSVLRSPAYSGGRQHRIRGTTLVVGTGGAVRPLYPLLVRARPSVDRPDDRTSLRRSKDFRLSQGRVYRPLPASVVILGPRNERFNRVSQPTGLSAVPHSQGVTGRYSAIY
jgi:hypothetical protein